jgi:hypothetical protein
MKYHYDNNRIHPKLLLIRGHSVFEKVSDFWERLIKFFVISFHSKDAVIIKEGQDIQESGSVWICSIAG